MHHITSFVNIHSLKLICRPDEQSVEIDISLPWSVKVDRAQVKSKNRGRHDYRTLLTIANSAVKSSPALPIYRQSWVISFWKSGLKIKCPKLCCRKHENLKWSVAPVHRNGGRARGFQKACWRYSCLIANVFVAAVLWTDLMRPSFLWLHQHRSMMALIWNDSDWTSVQFCQELRKTDKKHCGIVYNIWNFETIHSKTIFITSWWKVF